VISDILDTIATYQHLAKITDYPGQKLLGTRTILIFIPARVHYVSSSALNHPYSRLLTCGAGLEGKNINEIPNVK
jgi:hypothetical protein